MRCPRRVAAALAAWLVAWAAPVFAQEPDEEKAAWTGFYLAVGGGASFDTGISKGLEERIFIPIETDPSGLVDFRAGWRFYEYASLELQVQGLTGFSATSTSIDGTLDIQGVGFTPNLRGYLLTGRFQPYGVMGMGMAWLDFGDTGISGTSFAFRVGGGLETVVSDHFALDVGLTYMLTTGQLSDFDHLNFSATAVYRF